MSAKIKTYAELKTALINLADDDYRVFALKTIPLERPMLGVRLPAIAELAEVVPDEKIIDFIAVKPVAFEEVITRGFLIARLPYQEMLEYFDSQVNEIDDWCSCDTFVSAIRKSIDKKRVDFLQKKVMPLLDDERSFAVRVGLVCLLKSYIRGEYLELIFENTDKLGQHGDYYAKMAIAWLLAECFIKYPDITLDYLMRANVSKWIFNKTITKICDSRRVDDATKCYLKTLRKR